MQIACFIATDRINVAVSVISSSLYPVGGCNSRDSSQRAGTSLHRM